jgi:6-pyruvoyltetrahydropterin/6-carboxytetrahydropterin synthase
MPRWEIDKEIGFDYGHRVWTQKLNEKFSRDGTCICKHLHGHRGKVQIFLESNNKDAVYKLGMVTDFRHLDWAKKFFDDNIDHRFIIDRNDPLYDTMIGNRKLIDVCVAGTDYVAGWKLDVSDLVEDTPQREYFSGFFVVDFVPTSERLAEWTYKLVQHRMDELGVKVSKINWWETPKSRSAYIND